MRLINPLVRHRNTAVFPKGYPDGIEAEGQPARATESGLRNSARATIRTRRLVLREGEVPRTTIRSRAISEPPPRSRFETDDFPMAVRLFAGMEAVVAGSDVWVKSSPGEKFSIPGDSKFDIRVTEAYHYICHFG